MAMFTADKYFQTRLPYDPRRAVVWKEICRYLRRMYIPANATIADLGAGYGEFINQIEARERHAVDVSRDLERYFASEVTLHVASCTNMPSLKDDFFDIVFASNLLEHLTREELTSALSEILRILKPGGRVILIQPNFKYCVSDYFDDYTHIQIFTHISLADLLSSRGFSIVAVEGRFLPLSVKSTRLPIRGFLVRAYLAAPMKLFPGQMLVVAQKPASSSA